jgi:hypothetical protein
MASHMDDLLERMTALEHQIGAELDRTRERWRYRIDAGRVRFEHDVVAIHRRFRQGLLRFLRDSQILTIVTAPFIYGLLLPIALLDLSVTVYQAICFRAYGIARVTRGAYIVIDRQHLAYLNVIEKLNCVYCGYANGVFAYVREVAGRTEQYWCPIRHAQRMRAPHPHYRHFVDYGDAEGYRRRLIPLRQELAEKPASGDH